MTAAAIFDLDGTLIDSRPAVLRAYELAAESFPDGAERLAAIPEGQLLAMRVIECSELIAGSSRAAEFAQRYDEAYRLRSRDRVGLYDGVVEMLASLAGDGIRLGIVTNKGLSRTPADVAPLDGRGSGNDLFDVIVTADDTPERKPSPRPIEFALERTGWQPQTSVYVGDGPHDAESAMAAGLSFVGAGWGYYDKAALVDVGASVVCEQMAELAQAVRTALGAVR